MKKTRKVKFLYLQNKFQEILSIYDLKSAVRVGFGERFWDFHFFISPLKLISMQFAIIVFYPIYLLLIMSSPEIIISVK